ncbi:MAG: GNAT family N-acetyltransferase [Lachnospiraceae bacterium]|nr:GNAT family N-acetyltransferase [Lachnospiraceae bacterium]
MHIRPTESRDLDRIDEIFAAAKRFMRLSGNICQWSGSYPDRDAVLADMEHGVSYVMEDERGTVVATFAFIPGEEPTYCEINGAWLDSSPYCTIHRIASDGSGRGVLKRCLNWCFSRCANIRIDTHADNHKMRKGLMDYGFIECGIIRLTDGSDRIAFQKHIKI